MSDRKESTVLILTLLITLGIVGGGTWWFANRWRNFSNSTSTNTAASPLAANPADCLVSNTPAGLFNYGGSTTWAPIRREADLVLQKNCPQFRLRYTDPINDEPGSGTGIEMLIANQLAFSQSSRNLKPEENQKAQTKGFSLKEIPVALDGIAIAVNPSLNIPGLTVAQIKDIYTGKITNWRQVSGPNLPIIPYSRDPQAGGTVEFFVENVLNQEEFGSNVQFVHSTTPGVRQVASNPGGIYYASAPEIVDQCTIKPVPLINKSNQPISPYKEPFIPIESCRPDNRNQLNTDAIRSGDYPITRRLFVIIKLNGEIDQQAGEAYANWILTPQGQELIEKAGFVKLN
jgi:phosphate transport system substrate-binding protein